MMTFLCAAVDLIPEDIPVLSSEAAEAATPIRLKDPRKRRDVAAISGDEEVVGTSDGVSPECL